MLLKLVIFSCFQSFRKDEGKHGLNDKTSGYNLGIAAYNRCDFTSARNYFELELNEAKQAGNKHREGAAYTNLGVAYSCLADYEKAIEFHQQSLSIAKEIGAKVSEGGAYTNLGIGYKFLGDYKKATEFFQQSLSITKEIGDKSSEGKAYTNLGVAYHCLGDYNEAIKFHQQALSIAKEMGKKDSEGKAYNNLAIVYHSLADYKKAIKFQQQSLSIVKEIGEKGSEGAAYINLGNAYRCLGDYKEAIEFYQQALSITKEIGDKGSEGEAYINLAIAYGCLGDYKQTIEFNHRALRIAKEIGNKGSECKAYTNLGNAYRNLADYQKAIESHEESLSIAKEIGDKDTEGKAYTNIGSAYYSLCDYKKAKDFHERALWVAEGTGDKGSLGIAYTNLGCAYDSLGDYKKAIDSHQQSLNIAKEIGDKGSEQNAYSNLGRSFRKLHDFRKAEECFESSIKVFEEMRFLLQEKDEWKIIFRDQIDTYKYLWISQLQQNKTKEALLTAERGRAQALTDLMESQFGVKSTLSSPKEQMERITNISSLISSPTTFLVEALESVHFCLLHKGQEWQFMQKKINGTLKDMTDKAYEQIRATKPKAYEEIGVLKLATKPARCEDRSLDYPEDETTGDLSDRGTDEKEFTSPQAEGDSLRQLHDVMISPISHLIGDEELIIIPDGSSFFIPYAALVDQNSRYLSETLRIRLAPSLTSLRMLTECPEKRHCTAGALLVGNPWIETVRIKGKEIEQLPGAEEEVKMIGEILNVEPLTGKNATKDQVLRRLNAVSLVHIAAHGSAERGEILLSPNLGSSKRPKEKDYLLTMTDVLNAKLEAKLVVLSCCHSGRGKIKAEGVVGIARAFLGAGARSVIASLWKIDDEATLAFMSHFYKHLVKGESASKSLHEAMNIMRESKEFSAVKYWAPFILIGDDVTLNFDQ